jgi:orotidine-5'-phosphate decarboxylase
LRTLFAHKSTFFNTLFFATIVCTLKGRAVTLLATQAGCERTKASIDATERLIFALDVPTKDRARELIKALDGVVSFFKIGLELYMGSGLELVEELVKSKKKVFLDLKYYDVPETVKSAVGLVASLGASFLTIHGNGKIIQAAVEGRGNTTLKLLSVTVLTSLDNDDMKDLGFACTVRDLVMLRAKKAMEAGCDGVITSPEETAEVSKLARQIKGMDHKFLIVTPGIRPANSSHNDHKRWSTPTTAIKNGADYLVMGRPIKDSPNPRQSAIDIIAEMQTAFDSRQQ